MIKKSLCLVSVVAALALSPSNMEARAAIKQFNQQQESIFEFLADDMEYNKTQIIGKGIKKALIMLSDIIKSEQSADFSGGNNGKKD